MRILIVVDDAGDVRYVPLDRTVTLGGRGEGRVPLAGVEGPVLTVEVDRTGPFLMPGGPVTILVNGEPPPHGRPLAPDDEITFAGIEARVLEPPDLALETDGPAAPVALRRALDDRVATSDRRASLGSLEALLGPPDPSGPPLDPLLALALDAADGRRATLVARTVSGTRVVRRTTDASGPPVRAPGSALDEAERDRAALLVDAGETGSVLVTPLGGRPGLPLLLVVESDRPVDAEGAARLQALAAVARVGGLALEHRRRARLQEMNERMTAIGMVMAGVAHDIKNLMTGLRTGIYYLDEPLSGHEESRIREAWEILKGAQGSIAALVGDMLAYSKPRVPAPEPTDLGALIRHALEHMRERFRVREVALDVDLAELAPIRLDSAAIERCVLNLAGNALDAVSARTGRVAVRLTREADEAVLTIGDNGPGVPEEARERVFDLLYSTKGVRGTGFGLAITRKIIEAHEGRVRLLAGPERGATFEVRLPV